MANPKIQAATDTEAIAASAITAPVTDPTAPRTIDLERKPNGDVSSRPVMLPTTIVERLTHYANTHDTSVERLLADHSASLLNVTMPTGWLKTRGQVNFYTMAVERVYGHLVAERLNAIRKHETFTRSTAETKLAEFVTSKSRTGAPWDKLDDDGKLRAVAEVIDRYMPQANTDQPTA